MSYTQMNVIEHSEFSLFSSEPRDPRRIRRDAWRGREKRIQHPNSAVRLSRRHTLETPHDDQSYRSRVVLYGRTCEEAHAANSVGWC